MHVVSCVIMKISFEYCEDTSASKIECIRNCLHEGACHAEILIKTIISCSLDSSFGID